MQTEIFFCRGLIFRTTLQLGAAHWRTRQSVYRVGLVHCGFVLQPVELAD